MSKRPPIAFMSYARQDDMKLKGGITKFREHLSDAVELVTGEEFRIYQDWKDIGWGEDWKESIDKSLDEVIFLIPIITPRFLKSKNCRDEVEHFILREKELNRTDLILPVYFIDCPEMNNQSRNASDPIVKKIKEHQWTDWRKLRFVSIGSKLVKKRMDELAGQIRNALDRVAEDATQESDSDAEAVQETAPKDSRYRWEIIPKFRGSGTIAISVRPRFNEIRNWRFIYPENAKLMDWGSGVANKHGFTGVRTMSVEGQKGTLTFGDLSGEQVTLVGAGDTLTPGSSCYIVFREPFPRFVGFATADEPFGAPSKENFEYVTIP